MALNYPPMGYTGENVEGSNQAMVKPGIVRAATPAEALQGTRNDVFLSPASVNTFNAVNAPAADGVLQAKVVNVVTQAAQTSFELPATAKVGDMFLVASATGNTGGWIVTQLANQQIWSDVNSTTLGAVGTLEGDIHTSCMLLCVVADTEFVVIGNVEGLTFT